MGHVEQTNRQAVAHVVQGGASQDSEAHGEWPHAQARDVYLPTTHLNQNFGSVGTPLDVILFPSAAPGCHRCLFGAPSALF